MCSTFSAAEPSNLPPLGSGFEPKGETLWDGLSVPYGSGEKKIALIPPSHGKLTQNIKKKDHPQSREIKICVVIADREVSCMVPRKKERPGGGVDGLLGRVVI